MTKLALLFATLLALPVIGCVIAPTDALGGERSNTDPPHASQSTPIEDDQLQQPAQADGGTLEVRLPARAVLEEN